MKTKRRLGVAEKITSAIATWTFVLAFLSFCFAWMEWTVHAPAKLTFDDKTFIHLNLLLSLIASIQASVIMISNKYRDKKNDEILERLDKHDTKQTKILQHLEKVVIGGK